MSRFAMREASVLLLTRILPCGNEEILLGEHPKGRSGIVIIPPSETLKPGEGSYKAARRGKREEVRGIRVPKLDRIGLVEVLREADPDRNIRLHIFRGKITEGTPRIIPGGEFNWFRFYKLDDLPLDDMWPDAKYWIREALQIKPKGQLLGRRILLPSSPRFVVSRLSSFSSLPPSCQEIVDVAS